VVEVAAQAVEDGGVDQRQCAAGAAGGEGPGPVGIAVTLQALTHDCDRLVDEHHGRLGGRSDDERFDDADARVGSGVGWPCCDVQGRQHGAVEDLVRGVGGVPDRAGRHAEHHDAARAAAVARRAAGDPRPRPAKRRRVLHGHEPKPALGKPCALLVSVKRDIFRRGVGDVGDTPGERGALGVVGIGRRGHGVRACWRSRQRSSPRHRGAALLPSLPPSHSGKRKIQSRRGDSNPRPHHYESTHRVSHVPTGAHGSARIACIAEETGRTHAGSRTPWLPG
jgi:hypothetical protein